MVEIEEITDDKSNKGASSKKEDKKEDKLKKKRMLRKDFPTIGHMLANGSPESQGRPKTFCSVFGYPIFIAVCFAISLLIFHYAPHDKSVQPRGKFSRNRPPQAPPVVPGQQQQGQGQVPPSASEPPKNIEDMVPPEQGKDGEL